MFPVFRRNSYHRQRKHIFVNVTRSFWCCTFLLLIHALKLIGSLYLFLLLEQIQSLVIAQDLSTLPLLALRNLLQQSSIQSDEGYKLRKHAFERGVVKFVLNNLKMLYYQTGDIKDTKHPSTSSSLLSQ